MRNGLKQWRNDAQDSTHAADGVECEKLHKKQHLFFFCFIAHNGDVCLK